MKSIVNFIKQVWKISPGYILLIFFNALLSGAKIIFNTILPMLLINELIGDRTVSRLLLYGGLIVANNVVMTFLTDSITKYRDVKDEWVQNAMVEKMGERIMNLAYSYL